MKTFRLSSEDVTYCTSEEGVWIIN